MTRAEMCANVELLFQAASEMRAAHGTEHVRHDFWFKLSDLLDHQALSAPSHVNLGTNAGWGCGCLDCHPTDAVHVARAYIGEQP